MFFSQRKQTCITLWIWWALPPSGFHAGRHDSYKKTFGGGRSGSAVTVTPRHIHNSGAVGLVMISHYDISLGERYLLGNSVVNSQQNEGDN